MSHVDPSRPSPRRRAATGAAVVALALGGVGAAVAVKSSQPSSRHGVIAGCPASFTIPAPTVTAPAQTVGATPGPNFVQPAQSIVGAPIEVCGSTTPTTGGGGGTAILGVSATSVSFSASVGGSSPASQTVQVQNTGSGTNPTFTASSDQTWLTAAPTSGTATTAGGTTITISAALGSLTAATYTGHITVASAGVTGSPQTITVTFVVNAAAPPPVSGATLFVSPTGTDGTSGSNACTNSANPCATLNQAYHKATAGAVVSIAAGTYGAQTFTADSTKHVGDAYVELRGVNAASVKLGTVNLGAGVNSLRLAFVTADECKSDAIASHFAFDHDVCGDVYVHSPSGFQLTNTEVGPHSGGGDCIQISKGTTTDPNPANVFFDLDYVHDCTRPAGSTAHTDCLQVFGADGITIQRSRFINCATQGVFLSPANGGTFPGVNRVWGNMIGEVASPGSSIMFDAKSQTTFDVSVMYNTWGGNGAAQNGATGTYVGNVGRKSASSGATLYDHDVWTTSSYSGDNPAHALAVQDSSVATFDGHTVDSTYTGKASTARPFPLDTDLDGDPASGKAGADQ